MTEERRGGRSERRPWEPDRRPGRRLFVAVPLAEAVRARVAAVVEGVQAELGATVTRGRPPLRWVRLEGLHLTLRFLGPTPEHDVAGVAAAVERAAAAAIPFRIRIHGAGAFPGVDRPRAIWLGVVAGGSELGALATRLDDELEAAGWPREERPFRAHLTVARAEPVPEARDATLRLQAAAAALDETWQADRLVLFESHTGRGPARYEALREARFAG